MHERIEGNRAESAAPRACFSDKQAHTLTDRNLAVSATPPHPIPAPSAPASPRPGDTDPAGPDFGSFYRATLAPLRRYLAQVLGCSHEAENIAHDAYLRMHEAMHDRPVEKPTAFLYTTARRLALNYRTRRGNRMAPTDAAVLDTAAGSAPDAAHQLMARQETEALQEAIRSLPPGCREVLVLRNQEELSHDEIAQRLGIARSTVEKHLARALRLLREQMRAPAAPPENKT